MDIFEQQNSLDRLSSRFTQFIIAVDGALIGYAIKLLNEETLSLFLLPIGLAIFFWCISFYLGIKSMRYTFTERFKYLISNSKIRNPNFITTAMETSSLKRMEKELSKYNYRMYFSLYTGGISFIIWQILELIKRTYC